ncbi:MAG TPA: nucleoside recognition domain-containing protein, partial [Victivallales bacterium]|nr:nucleoside recognition domain-containing protein [Victivallales bacterium]
FAAKEVVVSTLATAYSLTDSEDEETENLSEKLAAQSDWNKVRAFAMMVFVMLYAPCFPTVVTIRKETGKWKWAFFSTIYSTVFGFIIATLIFQIGSLLF